MASWPHEVRLNCPECAEKITEMQYRVNFVMIEGERHRTMSEWWFNCGHNLIDSLYETEWEQADSGETWSAILDHNRDPILSWCEGVF